MPEEMLPRDGHHLVIASRTPLERVFRRLKLVRGDRRDLLREAMVTAAGAWLPLAVIAMIESTGVRPLEPLLRDFAVHVRLLVAVPMFLVAWQVLQRLFDQIFRALVGGKFLDDPSPLDRLAARAERLAASHVMEWTLLAVAVALGIGVYLQKLPIAPPLVEDRYGAPLGRGPAFTWYALVALPAFLFLGLRILFGWALWTLLLWRVSRLPLRLGATHPDRCGGVGFLCWPVDGLALAAFGLSAVAAAGWVTRIRAGARLEPAFAYSFLVLFGILFLLALLPLLAFGPALRRARRKDLHDWSRLAATYDRRFDRRWLEGVPGPDLLGTADLQSHADIDNVFRAIPDTRLIPLGRFEILELVVAVAIPMIPLALTIVPLQDLVLKLGGVLLGGK